MNPISYARYLSAYSTSRLAKNLGVSRQYLSRVEQGLYDKPNKDVVNWTVETINKHLDRPVNQVIVEQLYKEWQWQQRESVKLNKALAPVAVTEYAKVAQPTYREYGVICYHKVFADWRNDYWHSSHAFCVDMCLHPSPVAEYEEGITATMPSQLKKVLTQLDLIGAEFKTSER